MPIFEIKARVTIVGYQLVNADTEEQARQIFMRQSGADFDAIANTEAKEVLSVTMTKGQQR